MKNGWIILPVALLAVAAGCAPAFRGPAPTMRQAPQAAAAEERANDGHQTRVAENPTKAVKLHNREAAEMADELNALYSTGDSAAPPGGLQGKVKVDADPGSNSVIITTDPIYMERVVKLVKELDAEEGDLAASGKSFA
jgi:type II secretory pathway component GspD/PulD (secretin)